jgi:hypothetical protein
MSIYKALVEEPKESIDFSTVVFYAQPREKNRKNLHLRALGPKNRGS